MSETGLSANIEVTRICGLRDHAIKKMTQAVRLMAVAQEYANEAAVAAREAANDKVFNRYDRSNSAAYKRLFSSIDEAESLKVFTETTDAAIWVRILEDTGLERLMDAEAREAYFVQLETAPPPVTEDNIDASLRGFREDAKTIFQRGIANVFASLDRRFRSHDAFRFEDRIILTRMFNEYGSFAYYGKQRQQLVDVERVFAILDKQDPEGTDLVRLMEQERRGYTGPQQSVTTSRYLRVRGYKNGNAHLWFTRKDLVEKVNQQLAEFYGQVLPDGVAKDEPLPKSGLPAKNLSFYATPDDVARRLIRDVSLRVSDKPLRVLEPSAGVGGIVQVILNRVAEENRVRQAAVQVQIDAVEIEPSRAAQLRRIQGLTVFEANFLQMPPRPVYDLVLMNPPFSGVHWMEHVQHAYEFLAPGGTLKAILPVTAELGDSRQHVAFREWAKPRGRNWRGELAFDDLPPESFASSGTRVQTCILTLFRGQA